MGYTINDIKVDTSVFTLEDVKDAINRIFNIQSGDFYKLKGEKWYHDLLRAVTFHSGDRKQIISDITSLAQLQQLFMQVYVQHYKDLDAQLNQNILLISELNQTVRKLYNKCVMKLELQADVESFDVNEATVLQLFLGEYKSQNNKEEEFRKYRRSVIGLLGSSTPTSEFDAEQLGYVPHPDTFYRCALELCAIDNGFADESFPENIKNCLSHLALSEVKKGKIKSAVEKQADIMGVSYFTDGKYNSNYADFNLEGLELQEHAVAGPAYDNEPPVDRPMRRAIEDMCVYIAPPKNGKEKKSADNLKLMLKNAHCKISEEADGCDYYIYYPSTKGVDQVKQMATKLVHENDYGCSIFQSGDFGAYIYLAYSSLEDIDTNLRDSIVVAYEECSVKSIKDKAIENWKKQHVLKDPQDQMSRKVGAFIDNAADVAKTFAVGVKSSEDPSGKKISKFGKKVGGNAIIVASTLGKGFGKAASSLGSIVETLGDKGISKVSNDSFDKEILPAIQCDFLATTLFDLMKAGDL